MGLYNLIAKTFIALQITIGTVTTLESSSKSEKQPLVRPNIVFIIADDLGWNDVSFHGSDQILTPNIDMLAASGIALERYYSHPICTPARSALLTGKFAHTIGMQGYPLSPSEDRGIPLNEKLLPEYFNELGYATHLIGKWHVGNSRKVYLPTSRGFDTHFGHRGGVIDYYEYTILETWNTTDVSGLDLYRNLSPDWETQGYITDVYTEEARQIIKHHNESEPLFLMVSHNAVHAANGGAELQAPSEEVRAMRHIESPQRKIFGAMVKKLDDSVGDIVETLEEKGILNNTLIIFISDNGGPTTAEFVNYASNWPLRGMKMSPYEGGVRVVGLIWTPKRNENHLWKGYVHVVDWLPTLMGAAGATPQNNIDGINLWNNIISNTKSSRNMFSEIDDTVGFSTIVLDDYKLINDTKTNQNNMYLGESLRNIITEPPSYEKAIERSKVFSTFEKIGIHFEMNKLNLKNEIKVNCKHENASSCNAVNGKVCLYDIINDPCETKDLSDIYPDIVKKMQTHLQVEMKRVIPREDSILVYADPRSTPKLHNYVWTTFADDDEIF